MTQDQLRNAVLCLTTEQARQSWKREQEYNREHGLPYYERLIDVSTGHVISKCK